ncbi:MAG: hypothetical protein IPG39_01165 [Bacteroidetes bacterium]|nr:hypothetical protein [Bacteroidota bacterium]
MSSLAVETGLGVEMVSWGLLVNMFMAVVAVIKDMESGREQEACVKHGYCCRSKWVTMDESGGMAVDGSHIKGKSSRSITLMLS